NKKRATCAQLCRITLALGRRRYQRNEFDGERPSRLNIHAQSSKFAALGDDGNGNIVIMCNCSQETGRPDPTTRVRAHQRNVRHSELADQLSRNNSGGTAATANSKYTPFKAGGFRRQESVLVSGRD